jgi:hypothetical protein
MAFRILQVETKGAFADIASGTFSFLPQAVVSLEFWGWDFTVLCLLGWIVFSKIEIARPVGTGGDTISTANASLIIHDHNAILGTFVCRRDRTDIGTRWILAMKTGFGKPLPFDIRILSNFFLNHGIVGHPGWCFILKLTGHGAGFTVHTALEVNHHPVAKFPFCQIFSR